MCARNECGNARLRRQTTLRAHSRVHQVRHVIVEFHVLCVDLGFHVVIGVGRLTVQQDGFIRQLHFTTHTQYQVQSSFLLDVVVRLCPVIVNSNCIPNSCIFHIAKTGPLRCCPYRLRTLNGVIQVGENPSAWRSGKWIPHQCFKPDRKHDHLHFGPDSLLSQRGRKHQIPRVQISRCHRGGDGRVAMEPQKHKELHGQRCPMYHRAETSIFF